MFAERVGWLADLVRGMADQVIAARWSDADLAVLAGGVGADGRRLPASGWMALRRLGWGAVAPAGVVVSDRVRRIAEEEAARALRLACHRRAVVAALLATWPADPFARTDAECQRYGRRYPKAPTTRRSATAPGRSPHTFECMGGCPRGCVSWRARRSWRGR
ncbi:hypothetical protein OG799_22445 [Micromonospora sp. NBC_00898]|uniref:hypothetical protein n=1 Tax=Micromonospora sp. NBC_00898 TaxID=2975981 RepID=UPI003863778F|nr:hypothetical protein OG799_22445 [Micromonospora sp. NBC_00898]